jgi:hypothetical protein
VKIIQIYAPTSSHDDNEVDNLSKNISDLLNSSNTQFTIVMGDFNAKIGKTEGDKEATGSFGLGHRNDRGDRLIEFASSNKFKIINTFFKKRASRTWTRRSPDGMTKNETDFILTDKPNIFQDVKLINKVNVGSDHIMLLGKIKINTQLERQKLIKTKPSNLNVEKLGESRKKFQLQLENQFQLLHDEYKEIEANLDDWNEQIVEAIHKTASNIATTRRRHTATKVQTVPES